MRLHLVAAAIVACLNLPAAPPEDATRLLGSAQALLQQQKWKEAADEFRRAVTSAPQNADARLGLALALRGMGNVAQAIAEANTAVRLRPSFDDARIALGLMLQQQGDVDAAMRQYQSVLKRNPRSAEAHNWLGVAYMQKNQMAEAVSQFRNAIRLKADFIRAYNNLGSTLAQSGELDEGIRAFEAGLKHAPDDLQLRLNLGTALRTKGDAEGAIRELQFVAKQDPRNPEIHQQLALAYREKQDTDNAIREFETALTLNPESREGYYGLGQTLQQLAAARPRPAGRPPNPAAQEQMKAATGALNNGILAEAVEQLEKAVVSDPESAEVRAMLGLVLGRKGDLPGAVRQLEKAVALQPDSASAHFNLGAALWYSGDKEKAVSSLEKACVMDPAMAAAYSLRGVAYTEVNRFDEARQAFQRAIALNPKAPVVYFDLGALFLKTGELRQAISQFDAGLNLPSESGPPPDLAKTIDQLRAAIEGKQQPDGYNVLGRMLGLAGANARDVAAAFETAIRLKPDYAEAHNNLGLVWTQAGDDERATAAFRQAIRLRPDYADAHANLGAILTATDAVESVKELEKAVELQPGLLKAQYNLALAYGSSPRFGTDKEIAQLRKVLTLDANYPRAEFSLGKALLRKGLVTESITHLERAATKEPGFGEAQYQLGLALARAGRNDEANERLQKGRELIAASQRDQTVLLDMGEGKAALDKGELDQAVAKFRQVVRDRPQLAEAQYQLGVALSRKNDADGARVAFQRALEIEPTHEGARREADRLKPATMAAKSVDDPRRVVEVEEYVRTGKFVEVQPILESYLKERPESSWGWYALGYSLFAQQKIGESIKALAKSLSLDVSNANAHKVLGRNLMIIGRFDAAQREFELGEKYDPGSAELPFNLGRLFSIQDQWVPARAAFERALKIDPNYVEAIDGLAFALEALGEEPAAIAHYLKAARLNEERKGTFAAPYVNLSAYYNRTGDSQAGLEYAQKAVAVNAKADRGWFQMARAQERRGELDGAADSLARAIAINPRVSAYYYVLSTVCRRLGKQQESRDAMEMFSKLDRESNDLERRRREAARP